MGADLSDLLKRSLSGAGVLPADDLTARARSGVAIRICVVLFGGLLVAGHWTAPLGLATRALERNYASPGEKLYWSIHCFW
jgi:hypothetical protein